MPSRFLEIRLATDWSEKDPLSVKILKKVIIFVPEANPGYEGKMHLVSRWFVEFTDNEEPYREIGLSESGEVVLAGPSERDYGYWCDTGMSFPDFEGKEISEEVFDEYWERSRDFRSGDA